MCNTPSTDPRLKPQHIHCTVCNILAHHVNLAHTYTGGACKSDELSFRQHTTWWLHFTRRKLRWERPTEANHGSRNIFHITAIIGLGRSWSNKCITKIQTKVSAYVFKRSQRHQWQRKSQLYSTLVWRKRSGYLQQMDIHKGERQKMPAIIFEWFKNKLELNMSDRIHRYTLKGIQQEQGESVDDFISRLKNLAAKYWFHNNAIA